MNIWMMPLFFIISGPAVYYSLRSRSAGIFLKERFFRIMIPWLLTGIFVVAPPQVYLERLSHAEFSGNFLGRLVTSRGRLFQALQYDGVEIF